MSEQRPNPEKLLIRAQEEEREQQRGKLKIYLGAAPGVGKTYTMLQDALNKRAQGLDVVIGVAESHGRSEINAMLKDFEIIPRQAVHYRDKTLSEFDLDAALKRHPALILIDEMAHTNAPGLRHAKRWQDIKEILDRGIDVYTTLNVQHIESLNDIVTQIVGVRVKETVPDSMLESADTIEIVDLPPEDLLRRLQEGKVYIPEQAELAKENFFQKGNLIALRELALRAIAERVNAQVLLYRHGLGIERVWPTTERLLVCVGPGPASAKAIRVTRRLATSLQAEWIAVYVETSTLRSSEEQHNDAIKNLRLAELLGAETRILNGIDIAQEIIDFAHEWNVTKIIVGKKIRSRWREILFGSLADKLVRQSGDTGVYIITSQQKEITSPKRTTTKRRWPWRLYGITIAIVAAATLINFMLRIHLGPGILIMVYMLGVVIVAMRGNIGASALASVLSVIAYDFFFIPPFYSFSTSDIGYFITLIIMLIVALIISHLTILIRRQAETAHLAERRTATIHVLSRRLASTRGVDKLLHVSIRYLSEVFDSEIIALLPTNDRLTIRAKYHTEQQKLDAKEQSIAQWVFDLGQMAGLGTDTLPFSNALYVPLLGTQETLGVLRICPFKKGYLFNPEQIHLLEACSNQIALALEVDRLQEQAKNSELQAVTDRIRGALLHSVSNDLRSPLLAIMHSANTLKEASPKIDESQIQKLGNMISFESEQLNFLIDNLLQMTYLETAEIQLEKESYSLKEVVTALLQTLNTRFLEKPIHMHISDHLPNIPFDRTLIEAVFINLIDNTIKFTPPDSPVDIYANVEKDHIVVKVKDRGPGLAPDEIDKLFEKFYRGENIISERGMGLGLAICQSIVQAHGGKIWAENREGGGAAFCFTLPLQ